MKNAKSKFLALLACAALAAMLGLTACGGGSAASSSAASSSAASSSASESASTAAESSAAESSAAEEEATESEATESEATESEATEADAAATTVDVSEFENAWMGVSDKSETFYYAESADGAKGAMVVLDPASGNYVSFVGAVSTPQEGYVTIEDETTGNSLTFEVSAADEEGNVLVDLGEQGNAILAKCDLSELQQAFQTINDNANAVA
jgi:hypothetical protein